MEQLKKHENHFCANNDGECICECYSKGYEDGKEYGLNAKQDYADKAYQQAKEEVIEDIKKSLGKMR